MRFIVISLVAVVLAGVGVANVVLLGYGGTDRNDPVGRLSPLLHVAPPGPATTTTVDHRGGREGPDD